MNKMIRELVSIPKKTEASNQLSLDLRAPSGRARIALGNTDSRWRKINCNKDRCPHPKGSSQPFKQRHIGVHFEDYNGYSTSKNIFNRTEAIKIYVDSLLKALKKTKATEINISKKATVIIITWNLNLRG